MTPSAEFRQELLQAQDVEQQILGSHLQGGSFGILLTNIASWQNTTMTWTSQITHTRPLCLKRRWKAYICKAHGIDQDIKDKQGKKQEQIFGKPQTINFPFLCEDQIKSWEYLAVEKHDEYF